MKIENSGIIIGLDREEIEAILKLIGKLTYKDAKKTFELTDTQFNKLAAIHDGIRDKGGDDGRFR